MPKEKFHNTTQNRIIAMLEKTGLLTAEFFANAAEKLKPFAFKLRTVIETCKERVRFWVKAAFCGTKKRALLSAFSVAAPVFALSAVMLLTVSFKNVTFAYEVKCDGETIGYVSDAKIVTEASKKISKQIVNSDNPVTHPQVNIALVSSSEISDEDDISEKMIEASGELIGGTGVYDGNKLLLVADSKQRVENTIDQMKTEAMQETKACGVDIMNNISYKQGLFKSLRLEEDYEVRKKLDGKLSFKTMRIDNVTEKLPFTTINVNDPTQAQGYKRVDSQGQDGEISKRIQTTFVNGQQTDSQVVATEITAAAISEQVTVGTRATNIAEALKYLKSNGKLMLPLREDEFYISQQFGAFDTNPNGHTGLDMAASMGTQIYSPANGVVCEVVEGYTGYGKHIKLNCGNGMVLLFAHMSEIQVRVGDVLQVNDPIGRVGSTGNSTGPHLHFEVRINGVQVDPGPYLGLGSSTINPEAKPAGTTQPTASSSQSEHSTDTSGNAQQTTDSAHSKPQPTTPADSDTKKPTQADPTGKTDSTASDSTESASKTENTKNSDESGNQSDKDTDNSDNSDSSENSADSSDTE